jgi:hypothetical protein
MVSWCREGREFPREVATHDVFNLLKLIIETQEFIMSALSDLQDQVAATVGAEASAVTLIEGIAQQLKDALAAAGVNDPALVDLSDKLKASAGALSAAVAANTAAPAPAPVDATPPADPTV